MMFLILVVVVMTAVENSSKKEVKPEVKTEQVETIQLEKK